MKVIVRELGLVSYTKALARMRQFVDSRDQDTADELWCLEHPPVFTQGQGGRAAHVHAAGDIPIVQSDRGGQVTYHGPGQLVVYILMDLRRQALGPRELVKRIESSILALMDDFGIVAARRPGAPGVYVAGAKIAALGLRIRQGTSYHGLSLNVDLDLEPFSRIDPCGFKGLDVTRLKDFGLGMDCKSVARRLMPKLVSSLYGDSPAIELDYSSDDERQQTIADPQRDTGRKAAVVEYS